MKITFISNYMNHHQLPFSIEMVKLLGNNYKFIATKEFNKKRQKLGYEDMNTKYDFIIRAYEDESKAIDIINESDVVIIGSAPSKYIKQRLKKNQLTIRYSERFLKEKNRILLKLFYHKYVKDRIKNNNYYLLCSSAYTADDYNRIGLFVKRLYRWGYFPQTIEYNDINNIINSKEDNSIIWVGRFINWKHPEIVIKLAKMLLNDGYKFNIKMIGSGDEYDKIKMLINNNNLNNNIKLIGSMSPDEVRRYMEKSQIFLFTSDRNEGWGAVLNEAMNSACAVIASHEIGSVPFLIEDNKNGLIYEDANIEDLYYKLKSLLNNKKVLNHIGKEAYNTIINLWNPTIAAKRLIELSSSLLSNKTFDKYSNGPCSIATIIKDDWYMNK